MDINLNKKLPTKEDVLSHISDIDIYRFYSGAEVVLAGGLHSPLRKDNKPSFGYFEGESGEICFKDFVIGKGDCIKFVMLMFGLTYFEALSKIIIDFNLTSKYYTKNIKKTQKDYNPSNFKSREAILTEANKVTIGIKSRKWKLYDLKYWLQYGIDIDILEKYNVKPIEYIFLDEKPVKVDKYAYAFAEYKDNILTYKIYQPFNNDFKWINNHNDSVWQGWEQLPEKGDSLIITKSLKDVMSITNILEVPSVSLQAESIIPKDYIIDQLKDRFEVIYLLYDNDYNSSTNWGQEFAYKLVDKYQFLNLVIHSQFESKDFSDLVKKFGTEMAIEIFDKNISIPF